MRRNECLFNDHFGAAFIYKRKQNGWVFEQKLEPADDDGNVNFGRAVALNGNVLAVSALKAAPPAEEDPVIFYYMAIAAVIGPPPPVPGPGDEADGETGVVYVYRKKSGHQANRQ